MNDLYGLYLEFQKKVFRDENDDGRTARTMESRLKIDQRIASKTGQTYGRL